jgi:hypothetical protein
VAIGIVSILKINKVKLQKLTIKMGGGIIRPFLCERNIVVPHLPSFLGLPQARTENPSQKKTLSF